MSQSNATVSEKIILVGNDERLVYLLQRYFEASPYQLVPWLNTPSATEILKIHPVVVIFSTIELLENAQNILDHTSARDIPVLVCTSVAGEAHARELGADACLFHPLIYDDLMSVMAGVCPMDSNLSRL